MDGYDVIIKECIGSGFAQRGNCIYSVWLRPANDGDYFIFGLMYFNLMSHNKTEIDTIEICRGTYRFDNHDVVILSWLNE